MKRWLASTFIVLYLCALSYGIFSHALSFKTGSHPAMYFVVWDMFCGWSAYSHRLHVVGEGESGRYYELAPGPWGEVQPFGDLERRHYDVRGLVAGRLAANTLDKTSHEPITRMFVVEEWWPKKYNLPENVWALRFDDPKPLPEQIPRYYKIRHILDSDGTMLKTFPNWVAHLRNTAIYSNPRLQADMRRGKTFYAVQNGDGSGRGQMGGSGYGETTLIRQVGSPLGN